MAGQDKIEGEDDLQATKGCQTSIWGRRLTLYSCNFCRKDQISKVSQLGIHFTILSSSVESGGKKRTLINLYNIEHFRYYCVSVRASGMLENIDTTVTGSRGENNREDETEKKG